MLEKTTMTTFSGVYIDFGFFLPIVTPVAEVECKGLGLFILRIDDGCGGPIHADAEPPRVSVVK